MSPEARPVATQPVDPVFRVWSLLREQGFDAAVHYVEALDLNTETLQLRADLQASNERFENAYQYASLTQSEMLPTERYARLALFADGLGQTARAREYSEKAVDGVALDVSAAWLVRLGDECGAHSAAVHLLRALQAQMPGDARMPWWLSQTLARLPQDDAIQAERDEALERAYALNPTLHPSLPLQLVLMHRQQHDWPTVERICREVLAREPSNTELSWQLSHAQWQCGDAASAETTMADAYLLAPENGAAIAAIALYQIEQANYLDAEATLNVALALNPDDSLAAIDLAELELRRDDWEEGWPRYEARLARTDREDDNAVTLMTRRYKTWQGEPLAGKILIVYSEQGSGDDIQMVRFVPKLADQVRRAGGRLVLACRRSLRELFTRFYEDCVALEDGLPGRPDYSLPIMSLPLFLELRPDDVQGRAYLMTDSRKAKTWRNLVRAEGASKKLLHVGLVWSGSPTHRRDLQRSIPLNQLEPLFSVPDVMYYVLTPGREYEVTLLQQKDYPVQDLTPNYRYAFDDVAAHLGALDMLVTIDSAPLHLGGALGVPVLALLDHVSHWCWGTAQTQRWYDSVELLRQPQPGEWAPVLEQAKGYVQALRDARQQMKPSAGN